MKAGATSRRQQRGEYRRMTDRLTDVSQHVEIGAPMPPMPRQVPRITREDATRSYSYHRRTKLSDLVDGWQDVVFALAREGHGPARFMAALGISRSVFENLLRNEPEFREAMDWAAVLCRSWWETQGRDMAAGEAVGNAQVWYHNMVNRFGWRSTPVELVLEREVPLPVADLTPEEATARYTNWLTNTRALPKPS